VYVQIAFPLVQPLELHKHHEPNFTVFVWSVGCGGLAWYEQSGGLSLLLRVGYGGYSELSPGWMEEGGVI